MGGRASKAKGSRAEYQVRDYFRERGWEAHRVPSSGAAQGFPGDVEISKDGVKLIVEVKSRGDEYKNIYAMLDAAGGEAAYSFPGLGIMFRLSYSFDYLGLTGPKPLEFMGAQATPDRTQRKIIKMQELVKECDFLVIKVDYKPFIFIRYFK